tara:strand:- start:1444 stop:1788 length:345 start_codon:yes stop_codon:yes gene_type:complete
MSVFDSFDVNNRLLIESPILEQNKRTITSVIDSRRLDGILLLIISTCLFVNIFIRLHVTPIRKDAKKYWHLVQHVISAIICVITAYRGFEKIVITGKGKNILKSKIKNIVTNFT